MNPRLSYLVNGQLDGLLNSRETEELNRLLKTDPAAAEAFASAALLHHSLLTGFQSGTLPAQYALPATPSHNVTGKLLRFLPWGIAAAACITALAVIRSPSLPSSDHALAENAEFRDAGFAVLTRTVNPVWADTLSPVQGDFLTAGAFALSQGLVQIEFLSGVSIVIEGDAAFEILSAEEMKLTRGKIRARVPQPAIGFKIHTPQGTVLDLGTEFALDLSGDQHELHVFDGEVEWHPEQAGETLLREGEAIQLDRERSAAFPAQPDRFTDSGQLAEKFETHQERRFDHWRASSLEWRRHPALLAYYPMDQAGPWRRQLVPTQSHLSPGAIVAAERVPGRWPGKSALDFSPNGSRVRVHIPGEHRALTFSTWARIDSLDREFNALFLTDRYEEGEPHWQLTRDGRLFFSVRLEEGVSHHIHYSPVVWTHADSQRWLHLATTYDAATRTAVHYLNGEPISHETAPEDKAVPVLRIGNAQIGNWGLPTKNDPEFAVRNLNGCLDEFAIFDTALAPEEIERIYQSGKP